MGGPRGYGEPNESGRELLYFLSINETTVCNTWFSKSNIYSLSRRGNFLNPTNGTVLDYVIMKKSHRRRCLDVYVMLGAVCNTD